ncbi:phosphate acetyltransferase [Gulosibacter molinativorax]|uniref:Phosphate acetyltransferase n=1 Tax=Gulosibacter molinativorax TaxID=256821 RepID=A0ABT7CB94_9MICO|nr:phosphate acetyltransferase [Gulosibacter molinativorax]MDJ1372459.1 phosphate acetyltransferase [Gulosibacter molinativorax]
MTASIYITSSEGYSGKQAVGLGVLDTLTKHVGRVGLFRPIVEDPATDDVLSHMLDRVDASLGLTPEECVGATYDEVHDDGDAALAKIIQRYDAVARRCEAVVIIGSDFTDVGNPAELSFNARVATNLGAPVLLVLSGRNQNDLTPRTAEELGQVAAITLPELREEHAKLIAVVVNRAEPHALEEIQAEVKRVVREDAHGGKVPVWALPQNPILIAPTVTELATAVEGELYSGDEALMSREVLGVTVCGMSMENVLSRTFESGVAVVAADRTETLVALLLAQQADNFPSLAAIVVNGPFEFSSTIETLLRGVDLNVPIVRTQYGTFETSQRIINTRGRFSAANRRKVDAALQDFSQYIDHDELVELLNVPEPSVVTPLMFEYTLLDRARRDRKKIVLPEGEDDRILIAASTLLAREVADLVILGDADAIRRRAVELGVNVEAAEIISPQDPELVEKFATEYARLRAHKGVSIEDARLRVQDVSYFGTMMVHLGLADGMVSGAAHTTAHTIRPSFEIVKTKPSVSIVSSVFLMSLADRVLVYGDCAVNPAPTAEQLADIAVSSAETAAQFHIEPRVAMLSYSTGDSGTGEDVDKVREATRLVRERAPELPVEGPLQYDAATDMAVAAKKMPGSEVAGRASVFIFPDLNTGNNTYKAVQRSAGAVAIGPVLQGLNKPINDLSRGALVTDIINTVAITAIQAQAEAAAK